MKVIPVLVGVLAAATITAAEAVEKRNNYPGITMKVSDRQRALADGRAKASPPARAQGLIPFDPKVRVDGLADVVDGGTTTYEMAVANEGTDPLVGPLVVEIDFSPSFGTPVIVAPGWACHSTASAFTCEWPGTVLPGERTGSALFTVNIAPPYGTAAECDPERSPCVFFRASLGAHHADSAYSAVTVNGEVPPTAQDDAVVMAAVPVPSHFNILRNDMASQSFAFALIEAPQHGTFAIDPVTYQVLYTPGPAYPGTDTFRYRLTEPNGASDTARVTIGPLQGGISFDSALADIGNVEPGRIAMVLSWLENTTGQVLQGEQTVHAINQAEFPGILAGTPYDPADAVSDPSVFRQGGFFAGNDFEAVFSVVRPNPPIGTVWLARQRLTLSPVNSPDIILQAEIVSVARSGAAGDVPVFVRDDAFSVPADQPSIVHPLANDQSVAGHDFVPTATSIFNPFEDDGEPWLEGTAGFIEVAPPFGAEYTPPPGFVGPTSFWYADSEIVAGNWIRYDWAKVSLTVGSLPPPPTAVASGSATICAGASTGLTGSGGVSCSWVPATGLDDASSCTPTATPASTTTYTLTVRDAHNQPSTNSPTVTVTVSPLPIAAAGGSATITVGQSTPLFGSGGASCSWSPGIGLNNPGSCTPVASPVVTTTYALRVTSTAGCVSVNPATATITVVPATPADLVTAVLAPLLGRAGQPIPVVFATLNIGSGGAAASTTRFYLSRNAVLDSSDVAFGTFAMPALAGGGVRVDFLNPVIPGNANGNYYVIASADDGRVVFETNEANNTGVSPWRINIR